MKNHPRGLPYLFLTEMWERFGYYLMIGIFVLYMTDTKASGLALDRKSATDIFGTFIACVYITPFIGGLLADRLLGYRRAIIFGGCLMGIGYLLLAVNAFWPTLFSLPPDEKGLPAASPNGWVFYLSLFTMILGNGFFKPNISVLLGNLYNEEKYVALKDAGYSWFYFGINLGAFICNYFAAWLRNSIGWGAAFAAAGIGMFIGVAVFMIGNKHYAHADVRKKATPEEASQVSVMLLQVLLPAVAVAAMAVMLPKWMGFQPVFGSASNDAFLFGTIPIIGFFINIWRKASAGDRRPIASLLAIYAVVVAFWAVFKQNGTALTTWAEFYTDRSIAPALEKPLGAVYFLQTAKMDSAQFPIYDAQFRTQKDAGGKIAKHLTTDPYFQNVAPADRPAEKGEKKLISTELFQSVNPLWVMILTPALIAFFAFLRRRGKEPTTPAKIGWGIVVTALSTVVMVFACMACHTGAEKASPLWLVATYGVVTIGELCLSPMGLSLVSKMSPRHLTGVMMGGWQLATSVGNKLSGILASLWDDFDSKANYYWLNVGLLGAAALILFAMLGWLNRIFKEKGLV